MERGNLYKLPLSIVFPLANLFTKEGEMVIQVVTLIVKPELLNTFLIEANANANASRNEPGVIQFDFLQDIDDPYQFMLYEVYRSLEDIESHRQTAHFKHWTKYGIPLLLNDRIRKVYKDINSRFTHNNS